MIVPVRCMSCGKPIAQHWEEYCRRVKKGEKAGEVLTELGLERFCCRAAFMGTVEAIDNVGVFMK